MMGLEMAVALNYLPPMLWNIFAFLFVGTVIFMWGCLVYFSLYGVFP